MVQWWQAWGRRAALIAASAFSALVAFILFCLVTGPGHAVLAWLITPLSGGDLAIQGLSGNLPNHLSARQVELRDDKGPWLRAEGVSLDWRFFALLGNHANVENLRAERVVMLRPQVPRPTATQSTMRVDVGHLSVARIELDPSVLGRRAVLTASGSIHYDTRHNMSADVSARRLDGEGRYEVHAAIENDIARGTVSASETGAGLAGGVIGMPDIGPLALDVRAWANGTQNAVRIKASADLLNVFGGGTIDLAREEADIDFSAVAPRMRPNEQLSWRTLSLRGHMHGRFKTPDVDATLRIVDLAAGGMRAASLEAELKGRGGVADLKATAANLRVPGSNPNVFASAPAVLTMHAELAKPARPVRLAVEHPLLGIKGRLATQQQTAGHFDLNVKSLGAVAGAAGIALNGTAELSLDFSQGADGTKASIKGRIAARGDGALGRLLGGDARIAANATMRDVLDSTLQASLTGAAVSAKVRGRVSQGTQAFSGDVSISELARAVAGVAGTLNLRGTLNGPSDNLALAVEGSAMIATKGKARQRVTISARATGLPQLKNANVRLAGAFDGSPVNLNADVTGRGGNALKIALTRAKWRSLDANGTVVVAGSQPSGTVTLRVTRLADLSSLTGAPLSGSVTARAEFRSSAAFIRATAQSVASGTTNIGRIEVNGTIADPLGRPRLALSLTAPQISAPGLTGSAEARLEGPFETLAVKLNSSFATSEGQSFSVTADAQLDSAARHVVVSRFEGVWHDQTVTLAEPATFDYGGADMTFAATFRQGKAMHLTVGGSIPSKPGRSMNVKANGTADLAVVTSGLAAVGQHVQGKMVLNATVTGTTDKPQIAGTATISGGELNDYARGIRLTDIEATAEAQGTLIRLTKFTAKAGPGNVTGSGTVDLAAAGTPIDISFKANDARPIVSDLMTANLDADLKVEGKLSERTQVKGQLRIRQGNINLPEKFPAEVAKLDVRRSRTAPPPPPPPRARVRLELDVTSPGRVFVRGRGLEAEFEGELKVRGTTANPRVLGALEMRRGTFNLGGANLTFESGKISFNGQALRRRLDPTLDFVAQSEANGVTATLRIKGTASQPKIELTSSPQLPQDEILAQLLFGTSAKSLSAMQLASVASAAATLSGGGGGFDPVASVRKSLGLDRLALGSTQSAGGTGSSTTVEAGKYILRNVYVAARQDISGGTRALVQVDITKHLKAKAVVNTGPRAATTTSTPLQDQGDSIGLSYQFEY